MASEGIDVTANLSRRTAATGKRGHFAGESFEWKVHGVTSRWAIYIPFLTRCRSLYLVSVTETVSGMPVLHRRVVRRAWTAYITPGRRKKEQKEGRGKKSREGSIRKS